jgi:hypothetical protein
MSESKPITPELLNQAIKNIMGHKELPDMMISTGARIKMLCEASGVIPPIEFEDNVVYQVNPSSWRRK